MSESWRSSRAVGVRLGWRLLERIDQRVAAEGTTRNNWITRVIEAALAQRDGASGTKQ